jgi:hypothetical protein
MVRSPKRRWLVLVAAAAFLASLSGSAIADVGVPGGAFIDDDGNIHEGFIEALAAEGITRGCNPPRNDRFCPTNPVTRGEIAAMLVRSLHLTAGAGSDAFVDDDNSVFESDIDRLAAAGITRGCNPPDNDRFCPNDVVTRGEAAALLVRAFGLTLGLGTDQFVDDDGSIFESDIDRLAAAGITRGCNPPGNDRFCPDDAVLRQQMASMLGRALGLTAVSPRPPTEVVLSLGVPERGGVADLWLTSLDGGLLQSLTNTPDRIETDPSWSPDRTMVAYQVRQVGGDSSSIEVINVDGSSTRSLGEGFEPAWSPDSERIVFIGSGDDGSTVFVVDAAGGVPSPIFASGLVSAIQPQWASGGPFIAFSVVNLFATGAEYFVVVIEDDGTLEVTLPGIDTDFYGTELAYSAQCRSREGTESAGFIAHVGYDGSLQVDLTSPRTDGCDHDPKWSPDGSEIAFSRHLGDGTAELWVVSADGSSLRRITAGAVDVDQQWTPDGDALVFTRFQLGSESPDGIFVVSAHGGDPRSLIPDGFDFDVWG